MTPGPVLKKCMIWEEALDELSQLIVCVITVQISPSELVSSDPLTGNEIK